MPLILPSLQSELIDVFNKGKKDEWKNILDYKIRIEIEKKFKNEMSELKYI